MTTTFEATEIELALGECDKTNPLAPSDQKRLKVYKAWYSDDVSWVVWHRKNRPENIATISKVLDAFVNQDYKAYKPIWQQL